MDWQAITGALMLGAIGVVAAFMAGLRDWVASWMRWAATESYSRRIKRLSRFMLVLEQLRDMAWVDRVIVFRGHNCGGKPEPGKPYFVSALYGWSLGRTGITARYDLDVPVDTYHLQKVSRLLDGQVVRLKPAGMPDCTLKSHYVSEGVVESASFYLGLLANEMLYVSVGSASKDFDGAEMSAIASVVDRLRAVLNEA